ncbi:uncharacterized protein LOC124149174 [Haliotis rufescens]|uniref:uncharacterized protein LOC124149174 n=1 Tax=Haliotis rufescens TaxID=6454 RepID=UPI00201F87E4|nr:uncharacterized protein LOC124149174 [Haliotis rufescens]
MNSTDRKTTLGRKKFSDSETMFDNTSTANATLTLEQFSDQVALQLTPVILFIGILMLVGFFGNLMVCYIYTVKLKAISSRLFLVALGSLDLVMCGVCIPVEIVSIRYMYHFNHNWLCKFYGTLLLYCSITSGSILVAIAVDRYKLICRPCGKQITLREAKRAIYLSFFVSLVASTPPWITQGTRTIPVPHSNITGYTCATSDDVINTYYPIIYHGYQMLLFLTGIIVLSSLYSRILMRARKQMQFREKLKRNICVSNETLCDTPLALVRQHQARNPEKEETLSSKRSSRHEPSLTANKESHPMALDPAVMSQVRPYDASESSVGSFDERTYTCDFSGRDNQLLSEPTDRSTRSSHEEAVTINVVCRRGSMSLDQSDVTLSEIDPIAKEPEPEAPRGVIRTPQRVKEPGRVMVSRTTFIMIVITLVFVLSFLPHLCAIGARSILKKTFEDLDGSYLVLYHLCCRSYFIISAVNPLVYSFFNLKFRNEVKDVFRSICGRNT